MNRLRIAVILALLIASIATVAYSLPTSSSDTYYYDDSTYSNEVGYRYIGCNGGNYRTGNTSTGYWIQYGEYCSGYGSYCNQSYYDSVAGQWYVINCF